MHTGFPFASHCVLGGCAALICNQSCPTVVNPMGKLLLLVLQKSLITGGQ